MSNEYLRRADGSTYVLDPEEFQGPAGPQGPAYALTDADKKEIVNAVVAALPVYNGEVV